MTQTYDLRRDDIGWTVFDRWTNQTVVVFSAPQHGLVQAEAQELANQLNDRNRSGDRTVLQAPGQAPKGSAS